MKTFEEYFNEATNSENSYIEELFSIIGLSSARNATYTKTALGSNTIAKMIPKDWWKNNQSKVHDALKKAGYTDKRDWAETTLGSFSETLYTKGDSKVVIRTDLEGKSMKTYLVVKK